MQTYNGAVFTELDKFIKDAKLLGLLDERLQAGLPTFINTDPEHLPADLALLDRLDHLFACEMPDADA